jgi:hypothetical protein
LACVYFVDKIHFTPAKYGRSPDNPSAVLFWSDVWNDLLLQNKFPRLYSYAKNRNISVAQFLLNNHIEEQFHLPLSIQAFQEYQQLQDLIQNLQTSGNDKDIWEYTWGNTTYTASRFYHLTFKNLQPPRPFVWIWNSKCSNKIKVFTWLLMMDRLNVRNILKRKHFKIEGDDYSCPLCRQNREETTFHLLFLCPFSRECWRQLGFHWEFNLSFHQMMHAARIQDSNPFFMEIFMLGAWLIWKQ